MTQILPDNREMDRNHINQLLDKVIIGYLSHICFRTALPLLVQTGISWEPVETNCNKLASCFLKTRPNEQAF